MSISSTSASALQIQGHPHPHSLSVHSHTMNDSMNIASPVNKIIITPYNPLPPSSPSSATASNDISVGDIVRFRSFDSLQRKIRLYANCDAKVIETPQHPNTWYTLLLDDGSELKVRKSSFKKLSNQSIEKEKWINIRTLRRVEGEDDGVDTVEEEKYQKKLNEINEYYIQKKLAKDKKLNNNFRAVDDQQMNESDNDDDNDSVISDYSSVKAGDSDEKRGPRVSGRARHPPASFTVPPPKRSDRPRRETSQGHGTPKLSSSGKETPVRSRNNSKYLLGRRVLIVGGRKKGARGLVTKGANGYFTIIIDKDSINPSDNDGEWSIMKRSTDLQIITDSGELIAMERIPRRRREKKPKARQIIRDDDDDDDDSSDYLTESDNESHKHRRSSSNSYSRSRSGSRSGSISSISPRRGRSYSPSRSRSPSSEGSRHRYPSDSDSDLGRRIKSQPAEQLEKEAVSILMDILEKRQMSNGNGKKRRMDEDGKNGKRVRMHRLDVDEDDIPLDHEPFPTESSSHSVTPAPPLEDDYSMYTPLMSSSRFSSHHPSPSMAPVPPFDDSPSKMMGPPVMIHSLPSSTNTSPAFKGMYYNYSYNRPVNVVPDNHKNNHRPTFVQKLPGLPTARSPTLMSKSPSMMPHASPRSAPQYGPSPFSLAAVTPLSATILSTAAATVL